MLFFHAISTEAMHDKCIRGSCLRQVRFRQKKNNYSEYSISSIQAKKK
jgi:hypothetical protein